MPEISKLNIKYLQILILSILIFGCSPKKNDYVVDVYQTTQSGDNLKLIPKEQTKQSVKSKKVNLLIKWDQKIQEYVVELQITLKSQTHNIQMAPRALQTINFRKN